MDKIAKIIVEKKKTIIIIFIIATIVCSVLQLFVTKNFNMVDYLPENAPSTQALKIMNKEFTASIPNTNVMIKDVSLMEAMEYKKKLLDLDYVSGVLWLDDVVDIKVPLELHDKSSVEGFYKNKNALFSVTVDKGKEKEACASIREVIGAENFYSGEAPDLVSAQEGTGSEVAGAFLILIPAILLILFLFTKSWAEPILFIMTIGVSIILNMGWDDGTTERIVDWVNEKNGIATVCWHIHVPNDFTTYELGEILDWQKATYKPNATFDTAKATVKGTKEYDYLMLAIEDLAEQLLILQENNVPVLFRPFHEAEGNGGLLGEGAWFWWATAGADEYIKLWKLLYTELTEKYDLHNLIWTYNSYTYDTSPAWYPGDDFVDIVGFDKYNTVYNRYDGLTNCPNEDAISTIFYKLVDLTKGKKMVAMTENDTVPSLENLTVERAAWSYFCPWYLMDLKKLNKLLRFSL